MTDEEVKNFVSKTFKETIRKEKNLRDVAQSLYIFLTTPSNPSDNCVHHYNVDILNLFDPESQLINTKPVMKNKLKELLSDFKKFKVQVILVLDYKKRNDCKVFDSSTKIIANDSEIDEAFKSMHKRIMTKIKNDKDDKDDKDWIVLDVIIKHSIEIFEF